MKNILLILLCFPLLVFSQDEKRLALVIGNANYDKGPLNNPVNDALLIAQTLVSLDFDVILDTNLADKRSFKETIREFGNRRPNYDVAFVYYAGHGIQVGSENYLLPTKEVFESEIDVEDYGVSVQDIMRYLTGMSDQVNILILDACRDNPFEQNWNATRSLKGSGLAKIPPPTGSLIAFSTDAGNTAADGNGKNSVYSESLCKNMLLENTSLDQVFRNVRAQVLARTNRNQRPVESSQLTGEAFYLVKTDYEKDYNKIQQLIREGKLVLGLNKASQIIGKSNNVRALFYRALIYDELKMYNKSINDYSEIISIDSLHLSALRNRSILQAKIFKNYEKSLIDIQKILEIDPDNYRATILKVIILREDEDYEEALNLINEQITLYPDSSDLYTTRGGVNWYIANNESIVEEGQQTKFYLKALDDYSLAIQFDSINGPFRDRALVYNNLNNYKLAIRDYDKAIKLDSLNSDNYYRRSLAKYYDKNYSIDICISDISKSIDLKSDDSRYYFWRAFFYEKNEQYYNCLEDYKISAFLDSDPATYNCRGDVYFLLEDYDNSLIEYNKAIELFPDYIDSYLNKAETLIGMKEYNKALEVYNKIIETDAYNVDAYFGKSNIYYQEGDTENLLEILKKLIEIDPLDVVNYYAKAIVLFETENYNESLKYCNMAKEVDSTFSNAYTLSALVNIKLGKLKIAIKNYSSAIELANDVFDLREVYIYRAETYFNLKEYDNAILDLNYFNSLRPDEWNLDASFLEGLIYLEQKKYFVSLSIFNNIILKIDNYEDPNDFTFGYLSSLNNLKYKISEIYTKLGEIYSEINIQSLICKNYNIACKLGDCEIFNANCK